MAEALLASNTPLYVAGGKPVRAVPGEIPISPVITVPEVPVLVMAVPARIAYDSAKPRSTGVSPLAAGDRKAMAMRHIIKT